MALKWRHTPLHLALSEALLFLQDLVRANKKNNRAALAINSPCQGSMMRKALPRDNIIMNTD